MKNGFVNEAFRLYGSAEPKAQLTLKEKTMIAAVRASMEHLKISKSLDTIEVIKEIYFSAPETKLHKGAMTERVIYASHRLHMSESKIWRELRKARDLFNEYYLLSES